jgi:hypothetical protein
MTTSKTIRIAIAVTLIAGSVVGLFWVKGLASADGSVRIEVVDAKGAIRVPENYRTRYQALGSWAIAADSGRGSKEMHAVYASPGAIDAYRESGRFPDGTVLVKEVLGTSTKGMTTGTVSHADKLNGWFIMVKDGNNSHPENPLWGDGWGWSWFDADEPQRTTSTNYKSECQGCHVPAQSTDWVYVEGYPALRR